MALTATHLIRIGLGLDIVRVQARGSGFVVGSLGLRRVRGTLDAFAFRRFRGDRCRVLFIGLHGLSWSSLRLPPARRVSVPSVTRLAPPELPLPFLTPSLAVEVSLRVPEPP